MKRILRRLGFIPLGALCQKTSQEKYIDQYLEETFGINKRTFTNSLITLLLLSSLLMGSLLLLSGKSLITSSLVSLVFFLFLIKIIDHLIHTSYELQRTRKDITSILVLAEIWAVWEITGSIFDLIRYITRGNYPELCEKWQQLLIDINLGMDPEKSLRKFFKKNQYFELDHVITILLHRSTPDEAISLKIEEIKRNLHARYLSGLQKLSDLTSLIIGANGILPISLILIFLIAGLGNTPLIMIIPTLTTFLTALVLHLGFQNFFLDQSKEHILQENELGWFLLNLGRKLEKIDCQEIALTDLLFEEDTSFKIDSETMADIVYNLENTPLLEKTFNKFPNIRNTARLCDKFLTLDVRIAANSIKKIGATLNENSSIKIKVQKAIDAEKNRIKMIQAINAPILGLLISITPILSLIGNVRDLGSPNLLIFPNITPWWGLMASVSIIILGGIYTLRKLSGKTLDTVQLGFNLILFVSAFYIGTSFISQLY
ncbi:MAG: hypothetical protein ACE5R6_06745 [Candidatus Heimdallarchaeota archaeon]